MAGGVEILLVRIIGVRNLRKVRHAPYSERFYHVSP